MGAGPKCPEACFSELLVTSDAASPDSGSPVVRLGVALILLPCRQAQTLDGELERGIDPPLHPRRTMGRRVTIASVGERPEGDGSQARVCSGGQDLVGAGSGLGEAFEQFEFSEVDHGRGWIRGSDSSPSSRSMGSMRSRVNGFTGYPPPTTTTELCQQKDPPGARTRARLRRSGDRTGRWVEPGRPRAANGQTNRSMLARRPDLVRTYPVGNRDRSPRIAQYFRSGLLRRIRRGLVESPSQRSGITVASLTSR